MQLRVLPFGIAREIIGTSPFTLELEEGAVVQDLLDRLKVQFPELKKLRSIAVAVNDAYADGSQPVSGEDEIAIIPPVSGG